MTAYRCCGVNKGTNNMEKQAETKVERKKQTLSKNGVPLGRPKKPKGTHGKRKNIFIPSDLEVQTSNIKNFSATIAMWLRSRDRGDVAWLPVSSNVFERYRDDPGSFEILIYTELERPHVPVNKSIMRDYSRDPVIVERLFQVQTSMAKSALDALKRSDISREMIRSMFEKYKKIMDEKGSDLSLLDLTARGLQPIVAHSFLVLFELRRSHLPYLTDVFGPVSASL